MPSLRQLLAAHAPLLVLDAASTRVQVGWLGADGTARWEHADEEAGVGVFRCIEKLGVNVSDAGGFLFCDGPGSILGIRTVAMALRTWRVIAARPVFAYCSLALVGHAHGKTDATIIADARRDLWHAFRVDHGGELRRLPTSELTGDLVMPEHFRHWSPLPARVTRSTYSLPEIFPKVAHLELFKLVEQPDAFLHEEPSYVTWKPQIHRAPPPK